MVRSSSGQFLMLRSLLLAHRGGESNAVKVTISENDGPESFVNSCRGRSSRPLKNVGEAAETRQKQARKRSLRVENEHFEPAFNAVSAT
jgi:REP element-mobilizing transposase RayT